MSAVVSAIMEKCYNSQILAGMKVETTDVKPAMSVAIHQRLSTLMCNVSLWLNKKLCTYAEVFLSGQRWKARQETSLAACDLHLSWKCKN